MDAVSTIQTGIRMSPDLYNRLKRYAKRENRSLNNYVVTLLEAATRPQIPALKREDYPIDEDILALGGALSQPTEEELAADPRLAYILSK